MAILIKDSSADHLIRLLAERTGESITETVKKAVMERLERIPLSEKEITKRKKRLTKIIKKFDSMPTVDHRGADEIIGYNKDGHFD